MIAFVGRRIAATILILLLLAATVFLFQRLTPVNPVRLEVGPSAPNSVVEAARKRLGLDRPLTTQYVRYIEGLSRGDLGTSFRTQQPVGKDIRQFLPATAELAIYSIIVAGVLAVVFGVTGAAGWRGAGLFRLILVGGSSAPSFLLGLLGILLFFGHLHWLPATGRSSIADAPTGPTGLLTIDGLLHGRLDAVGDALQHLVLPSLCVALGPAVAIGRVLRSGLAAALSTDYARTARSKGLSEATVILRHGLRNSAGPVLAMTGLQVGIVFAGVVVVETIFAWPGIGLYVDQSIPAGDFPAIAGVTLLLGVGYVLINTTVDLLHALADPRIRR
jgi:peptide/nickel transport system permease protein